jgi:hypothetical protein
VVHASSIRIISASQFIPRVATWSSANLIQFSILTGYLVEQFTTRLTRNNLSSYRSVKIRPARRSMLPRQRQWHSVEDGSRLYTLNEPLEIEEFTSGSSNAPIFPSTSSTAVKPGKLQPLRNPNFDFCHSSQARSQSPTYTCNTTMLLSGLIISILCVAAASTLSSPQTSNYPPTSLSRGIVFVANLTDPSKDLSPSIHNWYLASARFIATSYWARLYSEGGWTYYLNGTDEEVAAGMATLGADRMIYPFSMGVGSVVNGTGGTVSVGIGYGTRGLGLRSPIPSLYTPSRGSFLVCNESAPDSTRPPYPVTFLGSVYQKGQEHLDVPAHCAPITFLAQCATLEPLRSDATYTHDFVKPAPCYENVSAIDWSKY